MPSKSTRNGDENRPTVKVQWPTTSIRWLSKGQWKCRGKWDTGKTCTFGSENICSVVQQPSYLVATESSGAAAVKIQAI